jgi:hypothetical protein
VEVERLRVYWIRHIPILSQRSRTDVMTDTAAEHAAVFFDRVRAMLDQIEISIDGRSRLTLSFS